MRGEGMKVAKGMEKRTGMPGDAACRRVGAGKGRRKRRNP